MMLRRLRIWWINMELDLAAQQSAHMREVERALEAKAERLAWKRRVLLSGTPSRRPRESV